MARPKFEYLLFDLPSDHEVEHRLATESATIESVVHNNGFGGRLKRVCMASKGRFLRKPNYKLDVSFIHLACHGSPSGIGLIGGSVPWGKAASVITSYLCPLASGQQRVMVFSCCHSTDGVTATSAALKPFVTGIYHVKKTEIPFATAITCWSMFYLKKDVAKPHAKIADDINAFLGEEVVVFKKP